MATITQTMESDATVAAFGHRWDGCPHWAPCNLIYGIERLTPVARPLLQLARIRLA
jgi:hypothetical protein